MIKTIGAHCPRISTRIAISMAVLLPCAASADLIFQADFNGSGTGTGGASDIVTLGGTGSFFSDNSGVTSIQSSNPFGSGGGSYLNINNPTDTSSGTWIGYTTFNPTSVANSWAAMQTINAGGSGFTDLNGGVDFFFRPNDVGDGGVVNNWVRFIDLYSNTAGDFRIVLNGDTGSDLRMELITPGSVNGMLTGAGYASPDSFEYMTGDLGGWVEGTDYHVGFTFSTDANHVVTTKLFGKAGTGAIDTSSNDDLLDTLTFKLDSTIVNNGLRTTSYNFNPAGYGSDAAASNKSVDADSFRMYDADPGTFGVIPEPSSFALILGGAVVGLALVRRRRA